MFVNQVYILDHTQYIFFFAGFFASTQNYVEIRRTIMYSGLHLKLHPTTSSEFIAIKNEYHTFRISAA